MNFVSFSPDYWDGPRHNRHYFCTELSKRAPVLFASPPFDVHRVLNDIGKGRLSKSGRREVSPTLVNHVPSKFLFTSYRFPAVNTWMRNQRVHALRRTMTEYRMKSPVLLIWHPQYKDMIGEFGEQLVVYYVYDQYSGYTGSASKIPHEADLLAKADVVFVLSKELYEEKRKQSKNVFHLPNAVDFDLFSRSRLPSTVVPADLESIPGPRIGYIGTMNEKLNLTVLEHVAQQRPSWSIVLIGRQNYTKEAEKQRFFDLVARPNVHWLEYRPFDEVPAYLKGLDVCLMCYVVNNWTFYGDPSKLHEYLASGKPTIGTGLTAIREFSDVVTVADAPEEWVDAIEAGLREGNRDLTERRIATARENSYSARVDTFLRVVSERVRS